MKKYTTYKETNIDWLPNIPDHWEFNRINHVTTVVSRKNKPTEELLSVYRDYGIIKKSSRDDNHNRAGENLKNYKYVEPTNLVINKMKTWQGSLGISEYTGIVSPAYITCEINNDRIFPRYFHYLLRCKIYIGEYNKFSYGVRVDQWDMRYNDFKRIPFYLPTFQEQQQIATYLDKKTSKIDEYISKKEKLIKLLEEQKKVIINNAVTKGIDSNVKLKDSGIEWLGDIPEHWEVRRLKYLAYVNPSKINICKDLKNNDQVTFLPMEKVSDEGVIDNNSIRKYKEVKNGFTCFSKNDVIRAKITPCFENGKGAFLHTMTTQIGFGSTEFHVLTANNEISPKYLYFVLISSTFSKLAEEYMTGTAGQKRVPANFIKNYVTGYPEIIEQKSIISSIEKLLDNTNKIIISITKEIELIKEYRQTLISKVVTGQIDVRGEIV